MTIESTAGKIVLTPAATFGVGIDTSGAKAAAAAGNAGQLFYQAGAAGVTDYLYICLKSVANTYSWVELANGG